MLFRPEKLKCQEGLKNRDFLKELIHSFCKKIELYTMCEQIKPERIVDILDRKECFLDQKSKISKQSKNQNFPKGLVHGFGLQIELFKFWTSEARKDRFLIFRIEKNAF